MFEAPIEWVCPESFPDLRRYSHIAIDLETKDPGLTKRGSGALINDGAIVGVAVAVNGWSGYFPFGHEQGNFFEERNVMDWVKEICALPSTKIFHNAMYDVCWLRAYGIKINGPIIDTMVMASLIDENRFSYSLNSVSYDYLKEVKDESALKAAADKAGVDPKAEMYKLPAMYVGAYAEKDAELALRLFNLLSETIKTEDLSEIFKLETDLFPCLIDMKIKGVRVDIEKAHQTKEKLLGQETALLQEIKKETQIDTQIWAARSIAKVFEKLKLPYERTAKTQAPSFTKNFLSTHKHPLVQKIAKAREINKAHTTFIDTIIKYEYRGRIHADINPIRGSGGGTVTGRFSYSNPNLQQVPARNKELGPMIRSLFLPERNHTWGCFDYSQQEPRLVVHYAASSNSICKDESVVEIVEKFKDESVDFHQTVADMANIERTQAKTINLGLFYGMGKAKLQAELGLNTRQEAEDLFDKYHESVPFVKDLMDKTSKTASQDGYIRTLLRRRCNFPKWEVNEFRRGKLSVTGTRIETEARFIENYKEKYPQVDEEKINLIRKNLSSEDQNLIKRAFTYKALNKLIQGSAADMTKKAMLDLYKEGIVPHIQIHDELDISVQSKEQVNKIIDIMENAVKLKVPNKVDYESGENWGDIYDK
jgi:DNA polymerase I-like protein with 3'-5' exonuclease and polymerase domains